MNRVYAAYYCRVAYELQMRYIKIRPSLRQAYMKALGLDSAV